MERSGEDWAKRKAIKGSSSFHLTKPIQVVVEIIGDEKLVAIVGECMWRRDYSLWRSVAVAIWR